MLVTEIEFCDFFVWTKGEKEEDTILICVHKDENFCKRLETKLCQVFHTVLLPELVTRNKDPNNKKEMKQYCYCKRPYFNPMIACDDIKCKIEWFYYSCVNILRTPNEKNKMVLSRLYITKRSTKKEKM